MITLHFSQEREKPHVSWYPYTSSVRNCKDLLTVVSRDYVCAEYKSNKRSKEGFIWSNCLGMDCDNDHSDDPTEWVTPEDVQEAFPDVEFYVHYSRNHMREKNGKTPRPKFHILFPIDTVTDAAEYAAMKKRIYKLWPYFDKMALDSARSFFGTEHPIVDHCPGSRNLSKYLSIYDQTNHKEDSTMNAMIPEGQRNTTLYSTAVKILKRHGDCGEARTQFAEEATKCVPPLHAAELDQIWSSAQRFYEKIVSESDYTAPDDFEKKMREAASSTKTESKTYKPADYSDLGQVAVLEKIYQDRLRFTTGTGFLFYDNNHWVESETRAQAMIQALTDCQLAEAQAMAKTATVALINTGAKHLLDTMSEKSALRVMNPAQLEAYQAANTAREYAKFVTNRRSSSNIRSTLQELRPKVEIATSALDADPFALCTPKYTYDLRLGLDGPRPHSATDYITKITAVSPSEKGKDLWADHLNKVFCGDQDLINYVQKICGTALIGQVKIEALIIANGSGRNGKSTFWNVIARVMGDYSGTISSDALTAGCRHNVRPELAELRGKRLVIAAEMREGARLDDGTIKKLASTDKISAEKKYRDPMDFIPSQTVVLYTNHLPKVSANDDGTWRRLWVIPFDATFEGRSDRKNYTEFLFQEAGEAIMAWLIEGARMAYEDEYNFAYPERVQQAIKTYREENDWLAHFLEDQCDVGESYTQASGALYVQYREYCHTYNEHVRNTADFYRALMAAGFERQIKGGSKYIKGLRLKLYDPKA